MSNKEFMGNCYLPVIDCLNEAWNYLDKVATDQWNSPQCFALDQMPAIEKALHELRRMSKDRCYNCDSPIQHDPAKVAECKKCGCHL